MVNLLCNYYCFIFTKLGIDCFHDIRFMGTRFFNKGQNPAHMPQDWFWSRKRKREKVLSNVFLPICQISMY